MFIHQLGIAEIIFSFLGILFTVGFPLAVLFALYVIYQKLKSIDEHLQKITDQK